MRYSVLVTFWKALTTLMVSGFGISIAGTLMDLPEDQNTFAATWPVYVVPVFLAAVRALENWRKNSGVAGQPRWVWPWDKIAPVVVVACLLPGCAGLGGTGLWRPAIGDHSQATVQFQERLADGSETKIKYTASGEAASKAGVNYTGEADANTTPWSLSVQGDQSVTSPQASTVASGYAKLLEEAPETITALVKQISAIDAITGATGTATSGIKETLIQIVVQRFVDRFLPATL